MGSQVLQPPVAMKIKSALNNVIVCSQMSFSEAKMSEKDYFAEFLLCFN